MQNLIAFQAANVVKAAPKKRQRSENDSESEKGEDVDFSKSYSDNDDKVESGSKEELESS